jgi:hypothetical protein
MAAFVVQVALVLWLGARQQPTPARPDFGMDVVLAGDESMAQWEKATWISDPTLLALPSFRGFSGPAWLRFNPPDYQPSEYSEPPRWLALDARILGNTFLSYVTTNDVLARPKSDRPLPPLQRYEPNYPNAAVPSQSQLQIEGELSGRLLPGQFELKSWPHSEILSNTIVQTAIDDEGRPVTTTLLQETASHEADLYALDLSRKARWRPRRVDSRRPDLLGKVTWGRLVFQWHTLPLSETNRVSSNQ